MLHLLFSARGASCPLCALVHLLSGEILVVYGELDCYCRHKIGVLLPVYLSAQVRNHATSPMSNFSFHFRPQGGLTYVHTRSS